MRLIVVLLEGGTFCAAQKQDGVVVPLRIEGREEPIRCTDESALKNAVLELQMTDEDWLIVVADRGGRALWRELLRAEPPLERLPADWELRRAEAIFHKPERGEGKGNDAVVLAERLAAEHLGPPPNASRTERSATNACEGVRREAEPDALRESDLERLATYLPALYEHFFGIVPPTDLALLCGKVTPPQVPNPWPEPAPETLRKLQANFRALPKGVQRQIVNVAKSLPQAPRLKPRVEMLKDLETLEGPE